MFYNHYLIVNNFENTLYEIEVYEYLIQQRKKHLSNFVKFCQTLSNFIKLF
jgi:hypothetical protein